MTAIERDTAAEPEIDRAEPRRGRVEDVSATQRTLVILVSQVVAIVALVILWRLLRNRTPGPPAPRVGT